MIFTLNSVRPVLHLAQSDAKHDPSVFASSRLTCYFPSERPMGLLGVKQVVVNCNIILRTQKVTALLTHINLV